MDARILRAALAATCLLFLGAGYRTQNFIVSAHSPQLAQQVAVDAERMRRDLAIEWLGRELPPWREICPIHVEAGSHLGAGGATSFSFMQGEPGGWTMSIQGSAERILDSVLPHEVMHTVFATHFGCPLPRWADEGACTTVEHFSERRKQDKLLEQFLTTGHGIPFNALFAMRDYPQDIMPLYSEGYSLARYLLAQGDKRKFVRYIGDGLKTNNWTKVTESHYGYRSLSELQLSWLDWVRRGSPANVEPPPSTMVASYEASAETGKLVAIPEVAPSSSIVPVSNHMQFASSNSSSGWYSRVRDEVARNQKEGSGSDGPNSTPAALSENQSVGDPSALSRIVSRPQALQQPRQQVLEWASGPKSGTSSVRRY